MAETGGGSSAPRSGGGSSAPRSGGGSSAPRSGGGAPPRQASIRQVLLVGVAVVGLVLGLAVLTSLLPPGAQAVVFRSPLAIVVLVLGTVGALVGLVVRRPAP